MLLRALLLLPLLGALLIAVLPRSAAPWLRRLAIVTAAVEMVLSWSLLFLFDGAIPEVQLFQSHPWNERVHSNFALGVDGISLPLVLLATLLSFVAVLASGAQQQGQKLYYCLLLVLETAMLGVFLARDWSLFYVFWEFTLIPLFFLIDRLGGPNRNRASLNFVLYTMGGSVFMLIALLLLYDVAPEHSFAMADMARGGRTLPEGKQLLIFVGLLIGFGVKMPIFPLHGWLPLAHVEAPSPVSILLSGILLKMGSYGLLRAVETLPGAALALQGMLVALALIGIVHGGVLAWRQRDLKVMVAYSSVAHMGVVLLGIASLTPAGLTGAVLQMVAHGLAAGAMFMLVGFLYHRAHSRDLGDYAGLGQSAPRFAFFIAFAFLAAVGLPGTAGFVAEFHILLGAFARWGGWLLLLSLGMLVSLAYALRVVQRLSLGVAGAPLADMNRSETLAAAVLCSGLLGLGLFPAGLIGLVSATTGQLARLFP